MPDERNELLSGLGRAKLIASGLVEDVSKDGKEVINVRDKDGKDLGVGGRLLEEVEDALEDDPVLDKVVLQVDGKRSRNTSSQQEQ